MLSASVCHASVSHVQFVNTPEVGVHRRGVTNVGLVALAIPPVPVEVAPPRVSTIAQTVVSSRTVLAAAVIVAVCGTPVEAVVLPMNWSCAKSAILARVTALLAIVRAFVLLAEPSKVEPALVTSPVVVPIVLAVVNLGADTIVMTGVVVVVATVASALAEVTEVTVPEPPDEATVTVPADAVPHVVNVIPLPSISCTLPPLAESVTV